MSQSTPSITGEILLDAGTNELEVLVFGVRGGWFGVNVAKVREVIRAVHPVATPHQHPSVLGMFNIRGSVLPIVDLGKHLGLSHLQGEQSEGRIIITEFNGHRCGFLVDRVEQIYRMSWGKVKPTPDVASLSARGVSAAASTTTGVIELGDRLVLMIDFESVADAILMDRKLHIDAVENDRGVDRASKRIVLVEDSPFMRQLITEVFRRSGYDRLEVYGDGEQAWRAVSAEGDPIDAIVSDIEMPRMDGLHLTKRVKDDPRLRGVPVVLFSSLICQDNLKKGKQVGADVQVPKPELAEMVRLVDRVVSGEAIDGSSITARAA